MTKAANQRTLNPPRIISPKLSNASPLHLEENPFIPHVRLPRDPSRGPVSPKKDGVSSNRSLDWTPGAFSIATAESREASRFKARLWCSNSRNATCKLLRILKRPQPSTPEFLPRNLSLDFGPEWRLLLKDIQVRAMNCSCSNWRIFRILLSFKAKQDPLVRSHFPHPESDGASSDIGGAGWIGILIMWASLHWSCWACEVFGQMGSNANGVGWISPVLTGFCPFSPVRVWLAPLRKTYDFEDLDWILTGL